MHSLESEDQPKPLKSSRELIGLTSGFAGLQVAFSIQFALLTSSLSSLGFNRTSISAIWLIPPVCGAILQPVLGAWSDVLSNRWGRRRPFIASGAIGLSVSLLAFGEVSSQSNKRSGYCGVPGACANLQLATVLLVLTINASATSIQMGLRALMVDICSDCQQSELNAWMARLTNGSNVLFYLLASIDLPELPGWAGQTQLQVLTRLSAILIGTTQSISCWYARYENRVYAPLVVESRPLGDGDFRYQWNLSNKMPSTRLWVIQGVQFLSWFAWFPFLAYISSYADQVHKEEKLLSGHYTTIHPVSYTPQAKASSQASKDKYGPSTLLCFASVASITTIIGPLVFSWLSPTTSNPSTPGHRGSSYQNNKPQVSTRWKRQMWYASQILYTISLLGILIVRSVTPLIIFVGMAGVSWAITQWIPFTLINIEISRLYQTNNTMCRTGHVASLQSLSNVAITAPQILVSLFGTLLFSYVGDTKDSSLVFGTRLLFVVCSLTSFLAACLVLRLDVK